MAPLRVGLDWPDDGLGEVLPLSVVFSTFSIALAAATLAPASGVEAAAVGAGLSLLSVFVAGVDVAGRPIERTFAFGFGASPPMLSTLGAPSFVVTGLFSSAEDDEPSAGRLAIVGTV